MTDRMTPRRREALLWAARGKTLEEVATILGVSPRTAEVHRRLAVDAMHASNMTHAVALAIKAGLIGFEEVA